MQDLHVTEILPQMITLTEAYIQVKTLKRYYAPIKMLITFQIWEQSTERSDVEMSN
jgi:U4/U6.U5 tri-snRNP-associated protein 2